MNLQGQVLEANDLCYKATGLTEEQVVGCSFEELPWWEQTEENKRNKKS